MLTRSRKVVVDTKIGNNINLPLEKVLQDAVKRDAASPAASTSAVSAAAPADSLDEDTRSRDRVER